MGGASATSPSLGKPAVNPWLIAIAVMLATFMEVLDTSVANVALNHIAGNLSASTDEATWVLTSYLVSNAVILPATGWLGRFFGRKRFLIACIGIFTIASALCGLASSLGWLILARILQSNRPRHVPRLGLEPRPTAPRLPRPQLTMQAPQKAEQER